jgi:hypothetical protein
MPETGTSSLMSGEGKRSACATPRLFSTLPRCWVVLAKTGLASWGGWIEGAGGKFA